MTQTKKTTSKNTKKSIKSTSQKGKKKSKSKLSKGKVYIAPYKLIALCGVIIAFCLVLLLITTFVDSSKKKELQQPITERYENTNKSIPAETKELQGPYSNSAKNSATTENKNTTQQKKPAGESKSVQKTMEKPVEKKTEKPVQQETPKPVEKKAVEAPKTQPTTKPESKPAIEHKEQKSEPKKTGFNFPEAKNGAQLIFVFDDGGQNMAHLEKFMTLPFPITVAILPQIAHSAESAARVRKSGNEVILHQPMQSVNSSVNPGPGAITPDMNEEQIKSLLFQNINQIAPIAGLNNHEGSAITADAEKMAVVLKMAAEESIYFLDSRTNVETKVPYVAGEMGYSYYERNIFLDNEKTRENVLKELNKGLVYANKNGSVIMIGHIWSADFLPAILQEAYPELKAKGYTFSVVSKSKAKKN